MSFLDKYKFWLESDYFDEDTKKELVSIRNDGAEIEDRFYKELEFGTGGLRGVLGAGTNRMNIYTVRKASQGLANYVAGRGEALKSRGVVIAYDSRNKSPEFAMEAARVFAGNGIRSWIFDELRPTPELSFAVRFLGTAAGVVITASHNPKQYNGYKAYGDDGAQLGLEESNSVISEISRLKDITDVRLANVEEALANGMIKIIGGEIDDEYIGMLKTLSLRGIAGGGSPEGFKIVFTPLHGAGNKLVRRILAENGFNNVLVVKEQELPDPEFTTVTYPNPEDRKAFKLAEELAGKEGADLIVGTDPDCDRVGVMVRNPQGDYEVLTGNQTGCLLMEYILSKKCAAGLLPANGFVVKTIVTTELGRKIAQNYNVELVEVLTGFKFIGEKIKELDEFGSKKYLFGFEESYGYLAGTFARDKDGVVTCMLIAEMAAAYRARGISLYEGLRELFQKYGYFLEESVSYTLEGKEGLERISDTMSVLRKERPQRFGDLKAGALRDYGSGERHDFETGEKALLELPQSNVLYYEMTGGDWFCIRPSGTEPKIKVYFGVSGDTRELAAEKLELHKAGVLETVRKLLGIRH